VDTKLLEWPENDFRIFVGNLGTDVTDQILTAAFQQYPSFQRARVVRQPHTNKSRGYGFVSLMDPVDGGAALREVHGKYIGSRPCQLKRSATEARTVTDHKGRAKKRVLPDKPEKAKKRPAQQHSGRQHNR
jgi:RNA recognition motif-containing protein